MGVEITDEMVEAAVHQATPHVSEGIGAILRKSCDSKEALKAREALHAIPEKDWAIFVDLLTDAATRAALEAVAPMIRSAALEDAAWVADCAYHQECCGGGVWSPPECWGNALDVPWTPKEIAAAIRTLKSKEKSNEDRIQL